MPEQGPLHAGFQRSADGESVPPRTPEGAMADSVEFGAQGTDIALVRLPEGTGECPSDPTPTAGGANG